MSPRTVWWALCLLVVFLASPLRFDPDHQIASALLLVDCNGRIVTVVVVKWGWMQGGLGSAIELADDEGHVIVLGAIVGERAGRIVNPLDDPLRWLVPVFPHDLECTLVSGM